MRGCSFRLGTGRAAGVAEGATSRLVGHVKRYEFVEHSGTEQSHIGANVSAEQRLHADFGGARALWLERCVEPCSAVHLVGKFGDRGGLEGTREIRVH